MNMAQERARKRRLREEELERQQTLRQKVLDRLRD
jgi:uncharacterized protein YnzC (UPF0291/DUF896 family)